MLPVVVITGSLIGFAGILVYAKDTLFGGTKPNRVSWLLWCVTPLTALAVRGGIEEAARSIKIGVTRLNYSHSMV